VSVGLFADVAGEDPFLLRLLRQDPLPALQTAAMHVLDGACVVQYLRSDRELASRHSPLHRRSGTPPHPSSSFIAYMGSVWLVYVDPWNRRREMEPQECKHLQPEAANN
jgi:hypothetical protein